MQKSLFLLSIVFLLSLPILVVAQGGISEHRPLDEAADQLSDRIRSEKYVGLKEIENISYFEIQLKSKEAWDSIFKTIDANRTEREKLSRQSEIKLARLKELQRKITENKKSQENGLDEDLDKTLDSLVTEANELHEELLSIKPPISRYEIEIPVYEVTKVGTDYIELKSRGRSSIRYLVPMSRIYKVTVF